MSHNFYFWYVIVLISNCITLKWTWSTQNYRGSSPKKEAFLTFIFISHVWGIWFHQSLLIFHDFTLLRFRSIHDLMRFWSPDTYLASAISLQELKEAIPLELEETYVVHSFRCTEANFRTIFILNFLTLWILFS